MKKVIFSTAVLFLTLVSCNEKKAEENNDAILVETDTTAIDRSSKSMETNALTYSCPMHPEVQGKSDDKCPKCGMDLTDIVE